MHYLFYYVDRLCVIKLGKLISILPNPLSFSGTSELVGLTTMLLNYIIQLLVGIITAAASESSNVGRRDSVFGTVTSAREMKTGYHLYYQR